MLPQYFPNKLRPFFSEAGIVINDGRSFASAATMPAIQFQLLSHEPQPRNASDSKRFQKGAEENKLAILKSIYPTQGRWKEAEELQAKELEIRSRVLEAEHPVTLSSMNNLAFTVEGQGLINKAILLIENCYRL